MINCDSNGDDSDSDMYDMYDTCDSDVNDDVNE